MNNKRKRLVERMIKIYGFEHSIVIEFCKLCERYANDEDNDRFLTILVKAHEANPQVDNDAGADK